MEPLGGVATVEKVAANAVMAGCRPDYFPVVLAAVQAILDPEFNLRGVQTTDENVAPLLVVNTNRIDFVKNADDLADLEARILAHRDGTVYYTPMPSRDRRKMLERRADAPADPAAKAAEAHEDSPLLQGAGADPAPAPAPRKEKPRKSRATTAAVEAGATGGETKRSRVVRPARSKTQVPERP